MTALAAAAAAAALAAPGLPPSFTAARTGPYGGTIWVGRIPNSFASWDHRLSAVYLPPGFSLDRRYPVAYLLHGMRGAPSSFYRSLALSTVLDRLIVEERLPPFIAVMPVAGPVVHPDGGEWAGVWEDYVVRDVVPWVDAHLPTIATARERAIAGLCAGGYGAVDIALRHPGLFGAVGAWDGYFHPLHDGPFVDASARDLAAHSPVLLVRREAAELRRDGIRFFLSVGGDHGVVRAAWTYDFARELAGLRLPAELDVVPRAEWRRFWGAQLPAALTFVGRALGGA